MQACALTCITGLDETRKSFWRSFDSGKVCTALSIVDAGHVGAFA